jgi:hypothetical protein
MIESGKPQGVLTLLAPLKHFILPMKDSHEQDEAEDSCAGSLTSASDTPCDDGKETTVEQRDAPTDCTELVGPEQLIALNDEKEKEESSGRRVTFSTLEIR